MSDVDLTCPTCEGTGTDPHYSVVNPACTQCRGMGRRHPSIIEWDTLAGDMGRLGEAVADTCWKATPLATQEDGSIASYVIPAGTLHRLVGVAQWAGATVSLRAEHLDDCAAFHLGYGGYGNCVRTLERCREEADRE